MGISEINEQTMETEVLGKKGVCIIDFYAVWCGPCKALAPLMEELAGEYGDRYGFYKVNVDESQALATKYRVMNIPTVVLLKDGQEADRIIGLVSKDEILKAIQAIA